jgi:hypothetical protein
MVYMDLLFIGKVPMVCSFLYPYIRTIPMSMTCNNLVSKYLNYQFGYNILEDPQSIFFKDYLSIVHFLN